MKDKTRRMTKRDQQRTLRTPKRKGPERFSPFGSIWSPQRSPKRLQERQKGAQESSKTLSKPFSNIKRRYFKNQWMHTLESRFLRFGGSSWRAKIDPKRLQERTKNDPEKHRTRRGEKNGNKKDQKETTRGHDTHWGITLRGQRLPGEDNLSKKNEQFNNHLGSNTPMAKGLANFLPRFAFEPSRGYICSGLWCCYVLQRASWKPGRK